MDAVRGDVTDADSLAAALRDVDVAYYLVHALRGGPGFEETDRHAAREFAEQARAAGVRRIVYLGGLTPAGASASELSPHLRSRAAVGDIFLRGGVPATVLRAAVIIGSGSASFEMLRYLTERLPVMVTLSWVGTRIQPIAVRDVLGYLVGCAEMPDDVNGAFDIGGPDVLTYEQMMHRYAAVAGLPHRLVLRVPMLTPRLSSYWIGLVTPVPPSLAKPLAGGNSRATGRGTPVPSPSSDSPTCSRDSGAAGATPDGLTGGVRRKVRKRPVSATVEGTYAYAAGRPTAQPSPWPRTRRRTPARTARGSRT